MDKKKIVFASHNAGKIRELQALVALLPFTIIPQAELGVEEIEETGYSFVENALLKARHASLQTGLPAIADDSGLTVPALKGAPGIYSARYAGKGAGSAANIQKLLNEMKGLTGIHREAAFQCFLVLMTHAYDPVPLICHGEWHGTILETPEGHDGFGYDPVFYDRSEKKSAATLTLETKNRLSHRGHALRALLAQLPESLC